MTATATKPVIDAQLFAEILKEACRDTDIACRPGGEEFSLILSGASTDAGMAVASRIRAMLAQETRRQGPVFTVSLLASQPAPSTANVPKRSCAPPMWHCTMQRTKAEIAVYWLKCPMSLEVVGAAHLVRLGRPILATTILLGLSHRTLRTGIQALRGLLPSHVAIPMEMLTLKVCCWWVKTILLIFRPNLLAAFVASRAPVLTINAAKSSPSIRATKSSFRSC